MAEKRGGQVKWDGGGAKCVGGAGESRATKRASGKVHSGKHNSEGVEVHRVVDCSIAIGNQTNDQKPRDIP